MEQSNMTSRLAIDSSELNTLRKIHATLMLAILKTETRGGEPSSALQEELRLKMSQYEEQICALQMGVVLGREKLDQFDAKVAAAADGGGQVDAAVGDGTDGGRLVDGGNAQEDGDGAEDVEGVGEHGEGGLILGGDGAVASSSRKHVRRRLELPR